MEEGGSQAGSWENRREHSGTEKEVMPTARIGDVTLHYDTRGQGEPLLLIMGYRGSGFMWGDELLTLLSRHFQVIYLITVVPG